jgi:cell division protease FtsH
MGFYRRWKIFWMNNWLAIVIIVFHLFLIWATIYGLSKLESFYRTMTLANIPLQLF